MPVMMRMHRRAESAVRVLAYLMTVGLVVALLLGVTLL